jgi:orotidine-5'-phosphate decarboxylase
VVIGDIKRGDIGSTSAAYAQGHIGSVEIGGKKFRGFEEDFATVNPYLGSDGVKPFIDICNAEDRGIFVLVKTSNPSSGELQDMKLADGRTIYEAMGDMCENWGSEGIGKFGYSDVGAVVGATYPEMITELRKRLPHTMFLVPGYGAQGGGAEGLKGGFDENGLGAIVNSSRAVMCAYKKEGCDEREFAQAARREVLRMREDICQYINLK